MVKVATWNVNSIKSRLEHTLEYLQSSERPDILLLQELKCIDEQFPYQYIEDLGYNIAVHGQKTYNGVAILSLYPIDDISITMGDYEDDQARYIEALISLEHSCLRVASVYVPNGKAPDSDKFIYKMNFLDALKQHATQLISYKENLVIGGDYNISPVLDIDVYNPEKLDGTICCHKDERAKFRSLVNLGLVDAYRAIHPNKSEFSWWDYRGGSWQQNKGMRIDHLLLSPEAADKLAGSFVNTTLRAKEKPSDHAPVVCELTL